MKVIWLASYPKSGNTWVRTIINEILTPNEIQMHTIRTFGKKELKPPFLQDIGGQNVAILKTHFHPRHKHFVDHGFETVGVITVHRHPLDIMLSATNYLKMKESARYFKDGVIKSVDEIVEAGEVGFYVDKFMECDGVETYRNMCSDWSKYQKRWDKFALQSEVPHLRLKYENMTKDPAKNIACIFDFLGKEGSTKNVEAVMKQTEEKTAKNGRFFWRKRAKNYLGTVPEADVLRFNEYFKPQMKTLGYTGFPTSIKSKDDQAAPAGSALEGVIDSEKQSAVASS